MPNSGLAYGMLLGRGQLVASHSLLVGVPCLDKIVGYFACVFGTVQSFRGILLRINLPWLIPSF